MRLGRKGGLARTRTLTKEQRSEIARRASLVFWRAMSPEDRRKFAMRLVRARLAKKKTKKPPLL